MDSTETIYFLIPNTCAIAQIGEPNINSAPEDNITHNLEPIGKFKPENSNIYPAQFQGTNYIAIGWKGPNSENTRETFIKGLKREVLNRCAGCALKKVCRNPQLSGYKLEGTRPQRLIVLNPNFINPQNN